MQESHKACSKCGEVKPLSEFYLRADRPGTHRPDCKTCVKKRRNRFYREAHPETERELSTTYVAMHLHLLAHFPKVGVCEACGQEAKTQHALIRGRTYSRNREDYRELCPTCHGQYDHGGERAYQAKLTAGQVVEIRLRYAVGGVSQKSLAGEYGVSAAQIWNIVHGHKWASVPHARGCPR